jgi:hypothetical protein
MRYQRLWYLHLHGEVEQSLCLLCLHSADTFTSLPRISLRGESSQEFSSAIVSRSNGLNDSPLPKNAIEFFAMIQTPIALGTIDSDGQGITLPA